MNIDPRMTKLRSQLVIQHPFYGFLASRLHIIEAPGIETMAVDGRNWFYDQKFLDECNEPKLTFCGAHEVMHCALNHPSRRVGRDPELWNIAADHVVNLQLQEAGFVVPENCYYDPQYKGMSVDDVYRILDAERQQEQDDGNKNKETEQSNPGDQRSGSKSTGADDPDRSNNQEYPSIGEMANGGYGTPALGASPSTASSKTHSDNRIIACDPGRCGGVIDAAPEYDQAALDEITDEWNVAVRQAINIARRQGEGKLPRFLEEVIVDLNTPKVDWRETLRSWIDPSSTKDYTWSKPNRRMLPFDIIAPGTTPDGINHVGFAIDDSASVDAAMLKQFAGEIQSALDDGKIDKATVIFCDTRVTRTAEYVMGDVIDFVATGRGGTRFSPAFKWFEENAPDVSGVVYLTDLDCNDWGPEPTFKTLWAAYEEPRFVNQLRARMEKIPFGECIELN